MAGEAARLAAAAAMQEALQDHTRNKKSNDIPLFYGISDRDTIKPQQLIDRIEAAAVMAEWDKAFPANDAAGEAAG